MIGALIGFFTALPDLLSLLRNGWAYLQKISGNDPAGWISRVAESMGQLNRAQTQEEHAAAAKSLADLLTHLPAR